MVRQLFWIVGIVLFILWLPVIAGLWLFNVAVERWRWTLAVVGALALWALLRAMP